MVRGNGSARAETSVKAAARPRTIRIRMRRGPLRDALDDDLSTITISPFVTCIALPLERLFLFGSGCAINADAPNPLALLRARCHRPSLRCAAEQRDGCASPSSDHLVGSQELLNRGRGGRRLRLVG